MFRQWSGAKRVDNSSIWFGVNKDAVLTGKETDLAIVPTICTANGTCTGGSFELSQDWIKLFILKNSSADISNMTHEEFDRIAHASVQEYDSIIGTNDPDLSQFRARGGKMISYRGMVSRALPTVPSLPQGCYFCLSWNAWLTSIRAIRSFLRMEVSIITILSWLWTQLCTTSTGYSSPPV